MRIGTLMCLLAAEPRSTSVLLFPCQCLCRTIFVNPYSMVWDRRVSRARPMPFYWPSCSLPFCLLLFSLSHLSFNELVLWGKGLRTDRVLITLSPGLALPTVINNNHSPKLDILGEKFDASSHAKTMCVVLFPVSVRELVC